MLENLTDAVKAVDMGLLLGSSLREELTEIAGTLTSFIFAGTYGIFSRVKLPMKYS